MELGECVDGTRNYLDTVRALHQTVVSLRAALEESRNEVLELKQTSWPLSSLETTLRTLTIENHLLRRRILDKKQIAVETTPEEHQKTLDKQVQVVGPTKPKTIEERTQIEEPQTKERQVKEKKGEQRKKQVRISSPELTTPGNNTRQCLEEEISIKIEKLCSRKISRSCESLTILRKPKDCHKRDLGVSRTLSFSSVMDSEGIGKNGRKGNFRGIDNVSVDSEKSDVDKSESNEAEDQEVDDIELIFTTDDTKDADFKEELVSIEATDETPKLLECPATEADLSDRELEDDVFNDSENQLFELRRESSQLYNSRSDNSINHEEKSQKSCLSYQDSSFENKSLEKDESFDRFEERVRIVETDISKIGIVDVEYTSGRRNTCPNPLQYRPMQHRDALNKRKTRPILAHSNAVRKDSGAQTDISAIPGTSWRSESNLVNKVKTGEHFTTLPSKFPMPGSKLRLSEKTVEARRVLLSDIGFTSMVPELSRSADYLCPPGGTNMRPATVTATYGQFLKTPDLYSPCYTSQRFMWTTTTATPSEGSHSQSRYSSLYPLTSPPPPLPRRCSAPVSPSRRMTLRGTPPRVRFANGSLPELRSDWSTTVDSGDSTDSLVEEAESFLRRSIDCIVTGTLYSETKRGVPRRASAPEPSRDSAPPQGWQPFLPRIPRDLRLEHWVKVISPEGRIRGGRVRYVGPLANQAEQFVGVQLSTPDGHSDGTYGTRRYFQCEPHHGIFVPFKKIVMGWRP